MCGVRVCVRVCVWGCMCGACGWGLSESMYGGWGVCGVCVGVCGVCVCVCGVWGS